MNAKLTALLLALTVLPAAASDLVSFPDGKPQDLNNLKAPVRIINFWAKLPRRDKNPNCICI